MTITSRSSHRINWSVSGMSNGESRTFVVSAGNVSKIFVVTRNIPASYFSFSSNSELVRTYLNYSFDVNFYNHGALSSNGYGTLWTLDYDSSKLNVSVSGSTVTYSLKKPQANLSSFTITARDIEGTCSKTYSISFIQSEYSFYFTYGDMTRELKEISVSQLSFTFFVVYKHNDNLLTGMYQSTRNTGSGMTLDEHYTLTISDSSKLKITRIGTGSGYSDAFRIEKVDGNENISNFPDVISIYPEFVNIDNDKKPSNIEFTV